MIISDHIVRCSYWASDDNTFSDTVGVDGTMLLELHMMPYKLWVLRLAYGGGAYNSIVAQVTNRPS